jgi:hypothetical protein
MTTSPASQTVDERCATLATDAAHRSGYIHRTRMHLAQINPTLAAGTQSGMFEVRELADRIIALRTMHALGDLTIDAADRGAIAGTLRSQQVTP